MSTKDKPNRLYFIVTGLIVLAVFASFLHFNFGWNITGFYKIGDQLPLAPRLVKEEVLINQDQIGYDGQFFLTIALDPLLSNPKTVESLDYPRYRMKRILLPIAAYLTGFGSEKIIPYSLVILNGLVICIAVFFLGKYRENSDRGRFFPFLFLCIPGVWITFGFSTTELLVAMLTIVSFYFFEKDEFIWVSAVIGLACLAKETAAIFWFAYVLTAVLERNAGFILSLFVSILPFACWQLYLTARFKGAGGLSELGNFGLPLGGHYSKIFEQLLSGDVNKNEYVFYLVLAFAGLYLISKLPSLWREQKFLFFSAAGYLFLMIQSSMHILSYHLSYNRVYLSMYTVLLLSERSKMSRSGKIFWILAGLASARFIYWYSR